MERYEYLADDSNDPLREFVRSLLQVIGNKANVLAYSSGFESGCLANLALQARYRTEIFPQERTGEY